MLTNQSSQRSRKQGLEIDEAASSPLEGVGGGFRRGGEFGLSADWREAIQERNDRVTGGGGDSGWGGLRGEACLAGAKREEVREVLERRKLTSSRKKVSQPSRRC